MISNDLLGNLTKVIDEAILRDIAPSISLFVGSGIDNKSDINIHRGIHKPHEKFYDLASITKILGITTAIARACALGLMDIKEKPFSLWPDVSIEKILAHTAGLPAHVKFYELDCVKSASKSTGKSILFSELFKIKPECNNKFLYSDLGFIALGDLLEKRFKKPLANIYKENEQMFGDNCSFIHDEQAVNDQNCQILGGVAGHAGLFGKLSDVTTAARFFLRCYQNPKSPAEEILNYFMKNHLGFQKPKPKGSIEDLSPQSFGHFGFTGVSLWVDPIHKNGSIIVLLTDRVAGSAKEEGIFHLRKKIHYLATT